MFAPKNLKRLSVQPNCKKWLKKIGRRKGNLLISYIAYTKTTTGGWQFKTGENSRLVGELEIMQEGLISNSL